MPTDAHSPRRGRTEVELTVEVQPVRGMNDVLPAEIGAWQRLEACIRELLASYGYDEIRVPVVEHTALFKRAIGEFTDVVEKEMYTFSDQGGESLTLRPEATAGIMRALVSNGMLRGQRHKLWCIGPMFRHERPQKGRYRQFNQLDVEAVGIPGPDVDAELIALSARLRRRLEGNPLRILDSKNPEMRAVIAGAPLLTDHLDPESREHFDALCSALESMGIPFRINPRLVRGLDYYTRTVFEWITDALGSQDAVCSGGRYDGLIAQLGGDATPAVG